MLVGLTGGIAAGKTLVSEELKRLGARVIDADALAREAVRPGEDAYLEIVEAFGRGILRPDGSIDRKALGAIVFSDSEALGKLNAITHPRIRKAIRDEAARISSREPDALIVLDVALLLESGAYADVEKVIVVAADEERLVERMGRRDGLTPEEAKRRLASQMPLKEKAAAADYLIENNGTPEEALERTREVFRKLTALKNMKKEA